MNEHNDWSKINYWEIISNISKNNKISMKDAIIKFYELTEFPSQNALNLILSENKLIPFNTHVQINDFFIYRFNGENSVISGIKVSNKMFSYLLSDYDEYLFEAKTLKIIS